jgi:hypothetical protein
MSRAWTERDTLQMYASTFSLQVSFSPDWDVFGRQICAHLWRNRLYHTAHDIIHVKYITESNRMADQLERKLRKLRDYSMRMDYTSQKLIPSHLSLSGYDHTSDMALFFCRFSQLDFVVPDCRTSELHTMSDLSLQKFDTGRSGSQLTRSWWTRKNSSIPSIQFFTQGGCVFCTWGRHKWPEWRGSRT